MDNSLDKLIQQRANQLKPYVPGATEKHIRRAYNLSTVTHLGSNENAFGMSPHTAKAIQDAAQKAYRYPDNQTLLVPLSRHLGVDQNQVVLGVGSTEVIDMVARAFLDANSETVMSEYGFAMFASMSQLAGAKVITAPAQDFGHAPDTMISAITGKTRVVWLANPNNPTGTYISPVVMEEFLAAIPKHVVVVIDEAYKEYLRPEDRPDSLAWLQKHPNLILLGTFSKIYGLAGMRVGYGVASPQIIDLLNRVKQPNNVSTIGMTAAVAALEDQAFVDNCYRQNQSGLVQLHEGLEKLGLSHLPSYGNFISIRVPNGPAVNETLLKQGILTRHLASYNMPNYLRITVGTPEENDRLLAALKAIAA